jgi:hypothetical protein
MSFESQNKEVLTKDFLKGYLFSWRLCVPKLPIFQTVYHVQQVQFRVC